MTTWGDLLERTRSLLKDTDAGGYKYTETVLRHFCAMALDELCHHTAKEVEVRFNNQSVKVDSPTVVYYNLLADCVYKLPVRPFGNFSAESAVMGVVGNEVAYYQPNPNRRMGQKGYYTFPEDTLHVNPAPQADELVVRYFGYWTHPDNLSSVLEIPAWAEGVISYRIAIHALSSIGIQIAGIKQWDKKGNIEANPIREQQNWLLKMYNDMLNWQPRQNRGLLYASGK